MTSKHLTIMMTDIKSFTPKASQSSRQELEHLLETHERLILPVFEQFGGTVIKTIGDAFLVTFESPTDAVLCGTEIQKILASHNRIAPPNDRLEIRVAINSGEVTIKNDDVFGEPVNITARLEGIADAGDIFFTEAVYLSMNKKEVPTAEVGYRHLKGIPHEIKIYRVVREGEDKIRAMTLVKSSPAARSLIFTPSRWSRKTKIIVAIIISILLLASWNKGGKDLSKVKNAPPPTPIAKPAPPPPATPTLSQQAAALIGQTRQAIQNGDQAKAKIYLAELEKISVRLGHPAQLEKDLRNLRRLYDRRF